MKKLISACLFKGLLFSAIIPLSGQKILNPEVMPVNTRIDNFLTMNGAANETTITIMFDKKGFLWSGTETGLYRFDGVRYTEYRSLAIDSSGFAGSLVFSIFEDSEGIIWAGTMGALNRLDLVTGRFTCFYPDPGGENPSNNVIRVIREDNDGLLWIATHGNIYSFNKKTSSFTEYKIPRVSWREPMEIHGDEPERFIIDSRGNIWCGTNNGLYCINHGSKDAKTIIPPASPGDDQKSHLIRFVSEGINGKIWTGTAAGELFIISPEDSVVRKIDFDPDRNNNEYYHPISSILHEKDGSVWLFGNKFFMHSGPANENKKIYIINTDHIKGAQPVLKNLIVNNAFFHPDSSIWMCCRANGAIIRFDIKTEKLSLYQLPNFIEFRYIMDKDGSVWAGSVRNNIFRLSANLTPWSVIPVNNGVRAEAESCRKIAAGPESTVWTNLTTGVYRIRLHDPYSSPAIQKLVIPGTDFRFSSVFNDNSMNLWLGENNGYIVKLNQSTGLFRKYKLQHPSISISDERIPVLDKDNRGNLWAVMALAGLYRYDMNSDRFIQVLDFNKYVKPSSSFTDLLVSRDGEIWILFLDRLLKLNQDADRITDYSSLLYENNLMYGYYGRIREDINGHIWLLNCHTGIYRFDKDKDLFIPFSSTGIRPGAVYVDLCTDRMGRVWIAHSDGITVLDPARNTYRLIRTGRIQCDCQGYEVNGKMVYINGSEIYVFNLDIPVNSTEPPVFLISLKVNGESYEKAAQTSCEIRELREINLRHYQNTLRMDFTAINYVDARNNTYFYFMKGIDDDTISSGTMNFAEYKKMKPGRYTFWVTAANNDGIINKTGTTLNINIKSPFYKSTLAYIFYSLVIISAILVYVRLRLKSIRKENIRLEKLVSQRTAELSIKNRQLEDVDRMKTKFFTDISHEIRTPLSLLLGPLDTLATENQFEPETENLFEMMRRNGRRLMQLVTQMLDISKLDSGMMRLVLSESDLTIFLRLLVYEFVSLAESRRIKYIVELPEKQHITLFDEDKMEKILTNLISNAFKFTSDGGTVNCIAKISKDSRNGESERLTFKIADTGEGIDNKDIDRIFERFYRVENNGGYIQDGTGVGLSLVKELVTLCHGSVEVRSAKGKGSVFEVNIPLGTNHLLPGEYIIASARQSGNESTGHKSWKYDVSEVIHTGNDSEKQRIIIIEDNEDLRNYLSANLEKNYSVTTAENGKEGLNLCLTLIPDLVITDIMMAGIDGISLCNKIKNDECTSHIPVIMLTARATADDKIEGLNAGADDYLVKPFNLTELKARISNLLSQRDRLKRKYGNFPEISLNEHEKESIDDRFMRKVILILNQNIHNFDFNIQILSEKLGMSRTHLFRKLKVLTGMSPVMLMKKLRMEKAAKMLISHSGNITEISYSVGISNPSYFARCFREHFGMSPKEYVAAKG